MAGWGNLWGSCNLWGVGLCQEQICSDADGRVLVQMNDEADNRLFRQMICDFMDSLGHYIDVCQTVSAAFDIENAFGDQLDKIGSIIGLRRQGFGDDRYRTFLLIQRDLLLNAAREDGNYTGMVNNLLTICRTFIGAGATPIRLTNLPPYAYRLSVPSVDLDELTVLVKFLCTATIGGVLGTLKFSSYTVSRWGSKTAGSAISGSGNWGSKTAGSAISDVLTWGFTVTVGLGNC